MRIAPRWIYAAIFVVCAGLLAFAGYLQEEVGLEPCPMCILQRYAFFAVAVVALLAALHGPRTPASRRTYAGLTIAFALLGAGTSARHSFLQRFPEPSTSCGADLQFLVNNFPLAQALPRIFAGTGECAKVDWRFLGLSIPEWAFVWFAIFIVVAAWVALRPRER